jgi:translation elongation factor P/translation initiation factor 5A
MNIYKLTYQNKEQAIADLESKGILTENGYGNGVQAVVEIGLIVLDVVDEQPIYAEGYHYDVMSTETYDFGSNLVVPKNPKHAFAGYPINEEVTTDGIQE